MRDALTGLAGANRPIRLHLSKAEGVSHDMLLVKHVSGIESICGGIEYCLLCVGPKAGIPTKQFITMPVEVQFVTDSGALRSVCGIVTSASEGQSDGGLATYQLIVRDALAILKRRTNSRIFRHASEVEITNTILGEWCRNDPVLSRAFNFEMRRLKGQLPVARLHDTAQRIRRRLPDVGCGSGAASPDSSRRANLPIPAVTRRPPTGWCYSMMRRCSSRTAPRPCATTATTAPKRPTASPRGMRCVRSRRATSRGRAGTIKRPA